MFRRFNDISIRGKLVVIVFGTVGVLTLMVLISVALSARRQVNNDVQEELQKAYTAFLANEGEHLHEHLIEAEGIARSDSMIDLVTKGHKEEACAWVSGVLTGRKAPIRPEESFDLMAIVLRNGTSFGAALNRGRCDEDKALQWRFPALSNKDHHSEITNWESPEGKFYELVESPVVDAEDHDLATLVVGFEVSDRLAQHIRKHTGQNSFLWHMDGNGPHVLGASDPVLKSLLGAMVAKNGLDFVSPRSGMNDKYSVLDASMQDKMDIVRNPEGLHIALVQSLEEKYLPFRRLEYGLLLLAGLALALGLLCGIAVSRPIARPLSTLATAAEYVAGGKWEGADGLLRSNGQRMEAKDEIGVLARSFLRMMQGLKERLAMSTFLSHATFEHIRHQADGGSTSIRTSLAVLFADVRQFSNFAETRDPQVVIQLLNQVLAIEAETVKKHGGDIDKFVGDAVIAWFSGPDRCYRAALAANEMIAALQARFNGEPGTTIGVGIHAGEVVLGSIGSAERKDYTAIGSTVNLAARLCSSAHPGQVLVSQAVAAELGTQLGLNPLAPISLKGFSGPVPVFEANPGGIAGG